MEECQWFMGEGFEGEKWWRLGLEMNYKNERNDALF